MKVYEPCGYVARMACLPSGADMYVWVSALIKLVGLKVLSDSASADDDLGEVVHDLSGVPSGKRAARDKTPPPPEVPVEVDLAEVVVLVVVAFVCVVAVVATLVTAFTVEVSAALEVELDGALQDRLPTERLLGFMERATTTSAAGFDRATALCDRRDQ